MISWGFHWWVGISLGHRVREDKGSLSWGHSCITLVYLVTRAGCLQPVCGNAEAEEYLT